MPPSWIVYVAVEDVGATVARAQELGGRLLAGPMPSPYGEFAALRDPLGAVFSAIALNEPDA